MSSNVHARLLMTRSSDKRATPASDREERMPEPLIEEELVKLTQRLQHRFTNESLRSVELTLQSASWTIQQRIVEEMVDVPVLQVQEQIVEVVHSILQGLWTHCGTDRGGCTAADHEGDSVGATRENSRAHRGRSSDRSRCRIAPRSESRTYPCHRREASSSYSSSGEKQLMVHRLTPSTKWWTFQSYTKGRILQRADGPEERGDPTGAVSGQDCPRCRL